MWIVLFVYPSLTLFKGFEASLFSEHLAFTVEDGDKAFGVRPTISYIDDVISFKALKSPA